MKRWSPLPHYLGFQRVFFLELTFIVCALMLFTFIWIHKGGNCNCLEEETQEEGVKVDASQENFGPHMPEKQQPEPYTVTDGGLPPLPIPYKYLLGSHPSEERYLVIGIASMKRERENYLMDTIRSIFDQLDPEELEELLIIVYLADYDASVSEETAKEINHKFQSHIASGYLIVICCSLKNYPTLEGLKRNFNDPEEQVKYRSKQNVDYAFLINFCANLSQYYLMLDDDVKCAKGFFTVIKNSVKEHDPSWTTISFSRSGYIGRLYHSKDLPKLARFLLLFYDEMPCDWLLDYFYKCKAQPEMISIVPSLFQLMGSLSSFQNRHNDLKDNQFPEFVCNSGDILPASCFTNMDVYEHYGPENVCEHSAAYFWGKNIRVGSFFRVVFKDAVRLQRILISTGSSEYPNDFLHSGYLQMGKEKIGGKGVKTCRKFSKIGNFQNGYFEINNFDKNIGDKIECLQIWVTSAQKAWLLIKNMCVWVLK